MNLNVRVNRGKEGQSSVHGKVSKLNNEENNIGCVVNYTHSSTQGSTWQLCYPGMPGFRGSLGPSGVQRQRPWSGG